MLGGLVEVWKIAGHPHENVAPVSCQHHPLRGVNSTGEQRGSHAVNSKTSVTSHLGTVLVPFAEGNEASQREIVNALGATQSVS